MLSPIRGHWSIFRAQQVTSRLGQRTLVWVDRKGKEEPIAATPNDYRTPRISPDGTKVALTVYSGEKADIWIWDLARETMTRLTFNEASSVPLWTPDGKRIAFVSEQGVLSTGRQPTARERKRNSVQRQIERLLPWSWSGDGKTLVLCEDAFAGASIRISALSRWKVTANGGRC